MRGNSCAKTWITNQIGTERDEKVFAEIKTIDRQVQVLYEELCKPLKTPCGVKDYLENNHSQNELNPYIITKNHTPYNI